MKRMIFAASIAALSATANAGVSYYACDVQVTFDKRAPRNTVWEHRENRYTKYLRLDSDAQMVSLYDNRGNVYKPICSADNHSCKKNWQKDSIQLDGTGAADAPTPFLDFRRLLSLTDSNRKVHLVIADYGQSTDGQPNMSWNYDGTCKVSEEPKPRAGNGPKAPPPSAKNPNYQVAEPAKAVSDAESAAALAGYEGNTMWGFSGGGHWFHMWFFPDGVSYAGDDEDITSEGRAAKVYVGKDSTGYRMCRVPIPAEGMANCYPLPPHKVGDTWVQHDMDGDTAFSLLPGRQ